MDTCLDIQQYLKHILLLCYNNIKGIDPMNEELIIFKEEVLDSILSTIKELLKVLDNADIELPRISQSECEQLPLEALVLLNDLESSIAQGVPCKKEESLMVFVNYWNTKINKYTIKLKNFDNNMWLSISTHRGKIVIPT